MLIYVYGGSGSGKSAYAEQRIVASGEKKRYYVATMEPFGTEGRRRIARHRALREGKKKAKLAELGAPSAGFFDMMIPTLEEILAMLPE